ncbi:unnamed protein product, partial [Meganyctiphanes norvegica]
MVKICVVFAFVIMCVAYCKAANPHRKTALHLAADSNEVSLARQLISAGANIEKGDAAGSTPLHYASWSGSTDVIATLLSHGANINSRDNNGGTPLMYAARQGQLTAAEALLNAGADPCAEDNHGLNAYSVAKTNAIKQL